MRYQYILGIGACLLALLVCVVGAFTASGRLATTYANHAAKDSSLACEIDLPGCSNCSAVPDKLVQCPGVTKASDGFWVPCSATTTTNSSTCQWGMTVLNAKEDQGFTAIDVRAHSLVVASHNTMLRMRTSSSSTLYSLRLGSVGPDATVLGPDDGRSHRAASAPSGRRRT